MKNKKTFLFVLSFCVAVVFADAKAAEPAFETVDGITWTYYVENGEAIVGYYDANNDSARTAVPNDTVGAITIPSMLGGYCVKRIRGGGASFSGKGITANEGGAFGSCSGLTSITIPDGVTNIGAGAFAGCTGLTSVAIPNSVTNIGPCAFYRCNSLAIVTLPDSLTDLNGCFTGCVPYERALARLAFGDGGALEGSFCTTTIVQQVESRYDLAASPADRAIASVAVDGDCTIDEFVLQDGKVYDSVLYISNTANFDVTLTLPPGYTYQAIKGTRPLVIPANSQSILSITRVADDVFLVAREDLETIE